MGYTHGNKWSDTEVENKIMEVVKTLNINRMPSNTEIIQVLNNKGLSNAIRRRGGFYQWAKKLNLEIKNSETKTGKGYEEKTFEMLKNKGYTLKRMSVKYPFDLIVNDKVSIDVKVGRAHWINGTRWHTIGINKKFATCDIYIIFALDEKDQIEKLFIIPGVEIKVTTLNFGSKSKYDKYIDRWDYIDKYLDFYDSIK